VDDRPPRPFSWTERINEQMRRRANPLDDKIGIGGRHPVLSVLGLWVLGIGVLVGLSFVLPRQLTAFLGVAIVIALLTTVRL
jgi:hypothetical protein